MKGEAFVFRERFASGKKEENLKENFHWCCRFLIEGFGGGFFMRSFCPHFFFPFLSFPSFYFSFTASLFAFRTRGILIPFTLPPEKKEKRRHHHDRLHPMSYAKDHGEKKTVIVEKKIHDGSRSSRTSAQEKRGTNVETCGTGRSHCPAPLCCNPEASTPGR